MNDHQSSLTIQLLGGFQIVADDHPIPSANWTRRKAQTLLKLLALSPNRQLHKESLIDRLWPNADIESGSNNLYRTLHALRQVIEPGNRAAKTQWVVVSDGVLQLAGAAYIDVETFERLVNQSKHAENPISLLEQAISLYRGDLLPEDQFEEWASTRRDLLRDRFLESGLALASVYLTEREVDRAAGVFVRVLEVDSAYEPAHRGLMDIYARTGRRQDALRQYQRCCEALMVDLGVNPSPETEALHQKISVSDLEPYALLEVSKGSGKWAIPTLVSVDDEQPTVGRDVELNILQQAVSHLRKGNGKVVIISGEPGVGKSHLALQVVRHASQLQIPTLIGAAYEQEGQIAFQPFFEAIRGWLKENNKKPESNPFIAFRPISGDPQQNQAALFAAVADFLADIGQGGPVVLIIDDLQAADQTSHALFHYLARQTRTAPLLLLATLREEVLAKTTAPLPAMLRNLYRERLSAQIQLHGLDFAATTQIIKQTLGGHSEPELVQKILEISEGNVFYTQEIVRALYDAKQIFQEGEIWRIVPGIQIGIPHEVRGLIRQRIAHLGEAVTTLLIVGSIVGREFNFEIVRLAANLDQTILLDALDTALSSGAVEESPIGYKFRHILIRQALYESLSRPRRAYLHGQVAQAFENLYANRQEVAEVLAFHWSASDQQYRALEYLGMATQKAAMLSAFEPAVQHIERALAIMDELQLEAHEQRFSLLENVGTFHLILANTPAAIAAFQQAIALHNTDNTQDWRPSAVDLARVRRRAAMALITAGSLDEADILLQDALRALESGPQDNGPEMPQVWYNIAQLYWHRNDYPKAFDAAQHSLALAERLGEKADIARAFEMLALACHSLGEWQQGIQFEEQREAITGISLEVTEAFDVHL